MTPGIRPAPLRPCSEPPGSTLATLGPKPSPANGISRSASRGERRRRRRPQQCADLNLACGVNRSGSSLCTPDGEAMRRFQAGGSSSSCSLPPTVTLRSTPTPMGSRKSRSAMKEDPLLMSAIAEGRWVEAHRRWQVLESSGAVFLLDKDTQARLRRIGSRFHESEEELTPAEKDAWGSPAQLGWGVFQLGVNTVQVTSSKVFKGIDALHAFVGLCEFDLLAKHGLGVLQATQLLQGAGQRDGDSLWHVLKKGRKGKEDNIFQVSCLDALDEPLGALWASTYVPWELEDPDVDVTGGRSRKPSDLQASELRGLTLPLPQEGAVRLDYWRTVYAIRPIWPDEMGKAPHEPSFHITLGMRRRPSSAACVFPSFMQKEVDNFWKSFRSYLENCRELGWRMCFSPNAALYDAVRRRLAISAPCGALSGPSLNRLNFADLSKHIPEDWAD